MADKNGKIDLQDVLDIINENDDEIINVNNKLPKDLSKVEKLLPPAGTSLLSGN